jgi:osmoprotectant transport system ATP-binding protein
LSSTCVEFLNIRKSFQKKSVIKNVSLKLPLNATTALVGESGSGKSTLLRMVNGLVLPDTGDVKLLGEKIDYKNLPAIRRTMGFAVQGAGLFPHLTVMENITLIARLESWSEERISQRYDELFDLLALSGEFSDRYPHMLSGGQQQRVSLCRAMMLNPPLMLLDEPFSALDPITRRNIQDEFLNLQTVERRSVILVTHDMGEAEKLADFLVIIREGEVIQQGTLAEVESNPADEYVSRLFDRDALN